ncbi:3-hydroxyacyl-ACP dehydratase FabZ [Buchnera aphidicola]|uniref:3-hydroxyacyl-ACP dehydratase FabZ n=1 Tax=Buchnera aphidicola TaxID=9 RepID=UPI002238707B|nr:3-hydroxyacyl-ACP dehydratase FabZ [Buchnera aphidicola]MCW5197662.1 3-hydroxyacyl-ACP dehydratase FabZ [Buchnera aphidicola (Chaitophorus viminalis)]
MSFLKKNTFLNFIPHRYPFLFVDQVIDFKKKKYLISKVKLNSNKFFSGHFPDNPIFPGVYILESMMQSAGILVGISNINFYFKKKIYYLTCIKEAKFKKIVFPNETLCIKIFFLNSLNNFIKFQGYAFVKNFLVCEAIFTLYIKK